MTDYNYSNEMKRATSGVDTIRQPKRSAPPLSLKLDSGWPSLGRRGGIGMLSLVKTDMVTED